MMCIGLNKKKEKKLRSMKSQALNPMTPAGSRTKAEPNNNKQFPIPSCVWKLLETVGNVSSKSRMMNDPNNSSVSQTPLIALTSEAATATLPSIPAASPVLPLSSSRPGAGPTHSSHDSTTSFKSSSPGKLQENPHHHKDTISDMSQDQGSYDYTPLVFNAHNVKEDNNFFNFKILSEAPPAPHPEPMEQAQSSMLILKAKSAGGAGSDVSSSESEWRKGKVNPGAPSQQSHCPKENNCKLHKGANNTKDGSPKREKNKKIIPNDESASKPSTIVTNNKTTAVKQWTGFPRDPIVINPVVLAKNRETNPVPGKPNNSPKNRKRNSPSPTALAVQAGKQDSEGVRRSFVSHLDENKLVQRQFWEVKKRKNTTNKYNNKRPESATGSVSVSPPASGVYSSPRVESPQSREFVVSEQMMSPSPSSRSMTPHSEKTMTTLGSSPTRPRRAIEQQQRQSGGKFKTKKIEKTAKVQASPSPEAQTTPAPSSTGSPRPQKQSTNRRNNNNNKKTTVKTKNNPKNFSWPPQADSSRVLETVFLNINRMEIELADRRDSGSVMTKLSYNNLIDAPDLYSQFYDSVVINGDKWQELKTTRVDRANTIGVQVNTFPVQGTQGLSENDKERGFSGEKIIIKKKITTDQLKNLHRKAPLSPEEFFNPLKGFSSSYDVKNERGGGGGGKLSPGTVDRATSSRDAIDLNRWFSWRKNLKPGEKIKIKRNTRKKEGAAAAGGIKTKGKSFFPKYKTKVLYRSKNNSRQELVQSRSNSQLSWSGSNNNDRIMFRARTKTTASKPHRSNKKKVGPRKFNESPSASPSEDYSLSFSERGRKHKLSRIRRYINEMVTAGVKK